MNHTYFFIEYPEIWFNEFNCYNLTAQLVYLNQSYKWEVVQEYPSSAFIVQKGGRRCRFHLNVNALMAQNGTKFSQIKENFGLVEYQNDDYDLVGLSLQFFGMPLGAKFYRQHMENLEITQAGVQYGWENSQACERGSTLNSDYHITLYREWDTIGFKNFVNPSLQIFGTQSVDNSCKCNTSYAPDQVRTLFYVSKFYNIYERYP